MIYTKFWIKTDTTDWLSPDNYAPLQGFIIDQLNETMPEPQRQTYTSPFASGVFDLTGKYLPQTFLNRDITFRLMSKLGCPHTNANRIVSLLHGKNICLSLDACNTYYEGFCTVDTVTESTQFRRITCVLDAKPFCAGKQIINSMTVPCYHTSDSIATGQKTLVDQSADSYDITGNGMEVTGVVGSFCTVKIPVEAGQNYVYLANVSKGEHMLTDSTLSKIYNPYFSPTEDYVYLTLTVTGRTVAEITNELLCKVEPYRINDIVTDLTLKSKDVASGYLVLVNGAIYNATNANDVVIPINDQVNIIALALESSVQLLNIQYPTTKMLIDRLEKSDDYA